MKENNGFVLIKEKTNRSRANAIDRFISIINGRFVMIIYFKFIRITHYRTCFRKF